ncbi:RHS repeat-associated core domain-containing protein [Massilia sp. 9I]|uniref:RHS repeat-associated core domain-containing protein n=1 Tax=Massilia sp. 9I TaxID=2653152 RepID=UPI0012F27E6D|nr:hypothetical protein MASSI9I_90095 [Massilia sp. 9I]
MREQDAWSVHYKARGEAKEAISKAAYQAGSQNPGQYRDGETGLQCGRHGYYDPHAGRFISRDPIGPFVPMLPAVSWRTVTHILQC